MRVAVISDVHSNLHALQAVLEAVDGERPDAIWCLGDVDIHDFAPDAVAAALWTRTVLGDRAQAFLAGLVPLADSGGVELFHASPRDPVWEYVLTDEAAAAALALTTAPIVLVGHSHVPLAVTAEDGEIVGGHAPAGTELELVERRWLLNPGSVGQPRDGDPRAAWLLLDLGRRHASFRRVPYAIAETQAEMRAAGLPGPLGERLASGA